LAAKIGIDGSRLKTMPDSALFLAAWQKWEEQAAAHLEGAYAAIISDNARNMVVAIRSPTDAPPLYYHETDDRVAIATMPKGLFAYGDVPRKLDEHKIADAMVLNYEINPGCYYEGLAYIRSGTLVKFTAEQQQTHAFFNLREAPEIRFKNDQDYVEAANALLKDAVSEYIPQDNIPAAHLSAGFDSSAVVMTMLDVLADRGMAEQKSIATPIFLNLIGMGALMGICVSGTNLVR
jgi:asparagine synthase (glutamine-hydrolysing)